MLVNVLYLQEAHYIFQERTFLLGRKNILITEDTVIISKLSQRKIEQLSN